MQHLCHHRLEVGILSNTHAAAGLPDRITICYLQSKGVGFLIRVIYMCRVRIADSLRAFQQFVKIFLCLPVAFALFQLLLVQCEVEGRQFLLLYTSVFIC